jgi:hypothetical protein
MMGETPCNFKIPKKSNLIQDGRIEFTFCLPDGREKRHVVELQGVKATNPVAEVVAAPFLLAGFGLVLLFAGDSDDEDSSWPSESQSEDERDRLSGTLLGLGFLVVGAGVYGLLGGDCESLRDYPVWVDFDAPPDADEREAPPGAQGTDNDCGGPQPPWRL